MRYYCYLAVFVMLTCYVKVASSNAENMLHESTAVVYPDDFQHRSLHSKLRQLRFGRTEQYYTIYGVVNPEVQVGAPILLSSGWRDYAGFTTVYFVPYDEYERAMANSIAFASVLDNCNSTYTLRIFRPLLMQSPARSGFNLEYYDYITGAGMYELCFVPDMPEGTYVLVCDLFVDLPNKDGERPFEEHIIPDPDVMRVYGYDMSYADKFKITIYGSINNNTMSYSGNDNHMNDHIIISSKSYKNGIAHYIELVNSTLFFVFGVIFGIILIKARVRKATINAK